MVSFSSALTFAAAAAVAGEDDDADDGELFKTL